MRAVLAAAILFAAPALAEPAMTVEEFEAYATGKTLSYAANGAIYGIETYLPGRRVIWAFVGDICEQGSYFQNGDYICFDYGPNVPLQCWTFVHGTNGLIAQFAEKGGPALTEVQQSDKPLGCTFEGVGV